MGISADIACTAMQPVSPGVLPYATYTQLRNKSTGMAGQGAAPTPCSPSLTFSPGELLPCLLEASTCVGRALRMEEGVGEPPRQGRG